jgi:hypothetical protein
LLVFAKEYTPNAAADTADTIYQTLGIKTTILLHPPKSLKTHSNEQRHFFHQILNHAHLWFVQTQKPFLYHSEQPKRNAQKVKRAWLRQHAIAFLEAAQALDLQNTQVKALLIHNAFQHICLGIIRLTMAYQPTTTAIGHLADLCNLTTTIMSEIFPRQTREEKALFRILTTATANLRHNKRPAYNTAPDLEILERRCALLRTETEIIAAQVISAISDTEV